MDLYGLGPPPQYLASSGVWFPITFGLLMPPALDASLGTAYIFKMLIYISAFLSIGQKSFRSTILPSYIAQKKVPLFTLGTRYLIVLDSSASVSKEQRSVLESVTTCFTFHIGLPASLS